MDTGQTSILLVEDEIITAMIEIKQLEGYGYRIHHVKTGEEAVRVVTGNLLPIDLILMDIDLGSGIDGIQAAEQILAVKDIPVVFVSSHTEKERVTKTEKITSYGYVVKNTGIVVLDASIKMALKLFASRTEYKKAEAERQELIGYLEKALDEIYVFNGNNLLFEYANSGAIRNLGFSMAELKTMTPVDIKPEFTESVFREMIRPLVAGTKEELHFETVHRRKDNGLYPVEIHLRYTPGPQGGKFSAFIMDITDRKRAEEELKSSEELFRYVFEKHSAVKLLIDPTDGKIMDANIAASKYYGWTQDQLRQMRMQDINILSSKEIMDEIAKAEKKDQNYFQSKHRRADGSIRDVEVYSSPIGIKGRRLLHSIIHDDTDRKRAEEELQKQIAEKETLLQEVHHRVKNNIASLMTLLTFQAEATDNMEVKRGLQEAIARAASMQDLYEKLLISKNYQEVSTEDYLEDLVGSILEVFNTHYGLHVETTITDFMLDSKRAIILGIITNELVTNSIKYAFVNRKSGTVRINLEKTDSLIRLIVQDDGVGFNEQTLKSKSTGFGLTTIKMLTEQLKGTFAMWSEQGTKSIVQF